MRRDVFIESNAPPNLHAILLAVFRALRCLCLQMCLDNTNDYDHSELQIVQNPAPKQVFITRRARENW